MSSINQSQMTPEGVEEMFATWEAVAPKEPHGGGWHDTLRSCADETGYFYACSILDYDEHGRIVQIGGAIVQNGQYQEWYV